MKNAMELKTRRASGVLGRLVREWTVDFDASLPHRQEDDGRLVMTVGDLRAILTENGLVVGAADATDGDYHAHANIGEIELIPRRPGRFSILLPEKEVMERLQAQNNSELRLATIYFEVKPGDNVIDLEKIVASVDDGNDATYQVTLEGEDRFRNFLDPYMASYMCTQCL